MSTDTTPAPIGADALRVAAQAALTALENLHEIDTEAECITIDVRDEIDALRAALASAAAPKAEPVPAGEREELREGASYESVNLAAMVLSDCGHSSSYTPLLERVAGRIDRHVERLLTAQREALTTRAQAAPAAVAHQGVVAWPVMPPSKGQSPVLFEDGYAEGWAKCLEACQAALAAAPAPAAQGDARLWCVHIHGPDEVHATPSRAAALERANELNEIFGQHPHEEGDPIMRAVVIEWPHSANAHKQDLADAARTAKHAADRAYQVHHASCSACQAAGKNSALQRCPQGRQLWDAAIDAARATKEESA